MVHMITRHSDSWVFEIWKKKFEKGEIEREIEEKSDLEEERELRIVWALDQEKRRKKSPEIPFPYIREEEERERDHSVREFM